MLVHMLAQHACLQLQQQIEDVTGVLAPSELWVAAVVSVHHLKRLAAWCCLTLPLASIPWLVALVVSWPCMEGDTVTGYEAKVSNSLLSMLQQYIRVLD
jgi:hypothetical protein